MLFTPGLVDDSRAVSKTCALQPLLVIVVIVHWRIEGIVGKWTGQSVDVGRPEGLATKSILLDQKEAKQVQIG